MRALMLVGLLAATPAFAADQFDLICTAANGRAHYRVDLVRGEACADDCLKVWKIGTVTSGEIHVVDQRPAFAGDLEERSVVSRQTGQWQYYVSVNEHVSSRTGMCEVSDFTGFPAAKF